MYTKFDCNISLPTMDVGGVSLFSTALRVFPVVYGIFPVVYGIVSPLKPTVDLIPYTSIEYD